MISKEKAIMKGAGRAGHVAGTDVITRLEEPELKRLNLVEHK